MSGKTGNGDFLTACIGSYFWVRLCKSKTAMFESEHNARFMTRYVVKRAFTFNLAKRNNASRGNYRWYKQHSTVETEIWTPKSPYYFLKCIERAVKTLSHGWNVRYGENLFCETKSSNGWKIVLLRFASLPWASTQPLIWWRGFHVINKKLRLGSFTIARHSRWRRHVCNDSSSLSAVTRFCR